MRNELKTIIENQFKETCHETSRHKQNNYDVIALLKEEIEYLKGKLKEKNKAISNLIGFVIVHRAVYKITHHHGYR